MESLQSLFPLPGMLSPATHSSLICSTEVSARLPPHQRSSLSTDRQVHDSRDLVCLTPCSIPSSPPTASVITY